MGCWCTDTSKMPRQKRVLVHIERRDEMGALYEAVTHVGRLGDFGEVLVDDLDINYRKVNPAFIKAWMPLPDNPYTHIN